MNVLIENESLYEFDFDYVKIANDVVRAVLEMEKCPYEVQVDIALVGDETIREINKEFRNIDMGTDVLSFPLVEFTKPANYDILNNSGVFYFEPVSGELMLGDIVISIPAATRQAMEYGHNFKREYAFLITHSVLHLLGYDHMSGEEMKTMEDKQEEVLTELKLTR